MPDILTAVPRGFMPEAETVPVASMVPEYEDDASLGHQVSRMVARPPLIMICKLVIEGQLKPPARSVTFPV